jgi:G3E family GTPase
VEYERISALSPVTVIDPMSFERGLKQYKDLYLDHIRYAGTIILSKCDLIRDSGIITSVKEKLSEINPEAEILSFDYRNAGEDFWTGLFDDRKTGGSFSSETSEDREEPDFEELSILNAGIESIGELVFFMEELIRFRYGHVIRAKGTIKVNDELVRADISDTRYLLSAAEKTAKQGFVLIGEELDKESVRMRLGFTPAVPRKATQIKKLLK